MVKMNGCAAIDSARPFRFLADKAAVAADFHLGNGACYYEEQRTASTASVATLARTGVVRPGFSCRIASKSGEYPHRSLPFRQAMLVFIHPCNLVGEMPQTPERFQRNRLRSILKSESGIFRLTAFRHIRFFLISVDRHLAKVSAHILYTKLRHPRLYQAEFFFIYEKFDLYRSLAIPVIWHLDSSLLLRIISNQNRSIIDMQFCVLLQNHA